MFVFEAVDVDVCFFHKEVEGNLDFALIIVKSIAKIEAASATTKTILLIVTATIKIKPT